MKISACTCSLVFIATLLVGCRAAPTAGALSPLLEPEPSKPVESHASTPTEALPARESATGTIPQHLPSVAVDPAYSESSPLKDTQRMFSILETLHELELANLAKPGWYLRYDLRVANLAPEDDAMYSVVHIIDSNGHCLEQLTFFRKAGRVSPFLFMGADGSRGSVNQVTGQVSAYDWPPSGCDPADPSSLSGMGTDEYILNQKLATYRQMIETMGQPGNINGTFSAWFAREDGQAVFVVQFGSVGPTGGVVMDSANGTSRSIEHVTRWDVYDLTNGRLLRSGEENILENGEKVGWENRHLLEYYPELPEEMRAALDNAIAGLKTP